MKQQERKQDRSATSVSLIIAWIFGLGMTSAVGMAAYQQPSAADGMAFYGTYHQNAWNQVIHFFGVPALLFSGIVFASHLKLPIFSLPSMPLLPSHPISLGTIWTLGYLIYYLCIDPVGGTLFAPILVAMYSTAVRWIDKDQQQVYAKHQARSSHDWRGSGKVLRWALYVQLLSWYGQIHPGHAVLEGAKPALLDSMGASFSNAPLFAFYEGVWALGWRQELHNQVQELIHEHTLELCRQNAEAMRMCSSM